MEARHGHGARFNSAEHRESVLRWIDKGEAEGAELIVDGAAVPPTRRTRRYFVGVTPSTTSRRNMEIYKEEIFAPVLGIVHAKTYDEALGLINGHNTQRTASSRRRRGRAGFKLEVDVADDRGHVPIPVRPATSRSGDRGHRLR